MARIFIVEDEKDILEMYRLRLIEEGHSVEYATNGLDAVGAVKRSLPDLVLLDIILPKMNGLQVLQELRDDLATRDLKIYILSNLNQSNDILRGKKQGADGYFVKSDLVPSQLARKVAEILAG
jgi:CheY-like chemotaxis protein